MRWTIVSLTLALLPGAILGQDSPPRSLDPKLKIELFAENPQIVTPTGLDVDYRGRVWAIENNTHQTPAGYKGHPSDRLLVMSDSDGDGRADKIVVFADGLKDAMNIALRPLWYAPPAAAGNADAARTPGLAAYVSTRREIFLLHDDDGDDRAERREMLVRLESTQDYPHNGLAALACDALGWLYFGRGMNRGTDYKLIGSDGTTLLGSAEGGSLYRCRLDGSKLERIATGFWIPHAIGFDAFGKLFAVDNDPDSRPPCRLLHIIQGGDYGYRYRNGRKGLHPFTSWDGEIPGTLPMIAGTGEAPSAVLSYESDGLPEEYVGNLLVTSWGDHRIDRFRLKPKGASFESLAEPLISGGENFRPVSLACAPDGSLYCSDWVLRNYEVHGRGRIWRISAAEAPQREVISLTSISGRSVEEQANLLNSPRADVRRMAATTLRITPVSRDQLWTAIRKRDFPKRGAYEALASAFLIPEVEANKDFDGAPAKKPPFLTGIKGRVVKHDLRGDEVDAALLQLLNQDTPLLQRTMTEATDLVTSVNRLTGDALKQLKATDSAAYDPGFPLTVIELAISNPFYNVIAASVENPGPLNNAIEAVDLADPFVFSAFVRALAATPAGTEPIVTRSKFGKEHPRMRLAALLAARRRDASLEGLLRDGLADRDPAVRRAAVQWVAEERLTGFRPQIEAILNDSAIGPELLLAGIAALEMLDGVAPAEFDKTPAGKYVLPLVRDAARPAAVRALALRMVDPAEPKLDGKLLASLLGSDDPALRLETVRTLQTSPVAEAASLLRSIAADDRADTNLRAEALLGLTRPAGDDKLAPETRDLLLKLLSGHDAALRSEALRTLRAFVATDAEIRQAIQKVSEGAGGEKSNWKDEIALALANTDGARPPPAEFRAALIEKARDTDDARVGGRIFFHANGAQCSRCHTVNGRGGRIGPDLSTIGRSLSRERLVDSILEPSREIAPDFVGWSLETSAGKVLTGTIVHENEGTTIVGDTDGKTTTLKTIDIVSRTPQKASVMPEKLAERMTAQEFRNLLAYLESLR